MARRLELYQSKLSKEKDMEPPREIAVARTAASTRLCKACNKEYEYDDYLDHVYDNMECYRVYLASEKKEMSKQ